MKNIIFIIILINYITLGAFSQKNINFEHLSLKEGLSQTTVNSIIQDHAGYLWFGTLDGLNKYDGYKMHVYRHSADSNSIPDNSINIIFEDSNNDIWIGISKKGLVKYNKYKDNFLLFQQNIHKNNIKANDINCIIENKQKKLLIGTASGLFIFDKENKKWELLHENKFNRQQIYALKQDKNNNIWIGTNKGLYFFNKKNNKVSRIKNNTINTVKSLFIDNNNTVWIGTTNGLYHSKNNTDTIVFISSIINKYQINTIYQDFENNLWFGTENNGLIKYSSNKNTYKQYINNPLDSKSLSVNTIYSIFEDQSHILWVGTSLGGINKYNRAAKSFETINNNPSNRNSLSSDQVRAIYEDSKQNIWICTKYGGLNKWNKSKNQFEHFKYNPKNSNSIQDNYVRCIIEDKNNKYWVGTDTAGFAYFDLKTKKFFHYKNNPQNSNSLSNNQIWRIAKDKQGLLYIATFGGGLNIFNPKTKNFIIYKNDPNDSNSLSNNFVTTVYIDSKEQIWVGTYDGGLNLFLPKNKKFIRYPQKSEQKQFIDRIYCITEDSEGNIWTGTRGSINKLNQENKKFEIYNHEQYGFPNHVLMSIVDDYNGNLWVTTNNGLSKFNKKTHSIRNYFESDGLQSNEFMIGAYLRTNSGEILFGGVRGLNIFDPTKIHDNQHKPNVLITNFSVLNQEYPLDTMIAYKRQIEIDYSDNVISFEFVGLDYAFSKNNNYAYKLQNFDKEWIKSNNRRFASYTNLSPGHYIFQVKASNNDNIWNQVGTEVHIYIKPPFWKTKWFIISLLIVIVLLIYLGLKLRDVFRDRNKLESEVKKRTIEVVQQKEEIESQLEQIENQRNRLQTAYKNIKQLSDIGQKITSNLSVETIEKTVYHEIRNLINADIVKISIFNPDINKLYFSETEKEISIALDIKPENYLACWSYFHQKDVHIKNKNTEINNYITNKDNLLDFEKKSESIIYIPIISKSKSIGVLTVQNKKPNQYNFYHLSIIKNLATHIGIALDNANAYQQIEYQRKGIMDSIQYAKRIQSAMLPPEQIINKYFKDYFIYYKPRDIVSGDFYWATQTQINQEKHTIIAAADCTGHGVPGAFMSMLGISLLNEIVDKYLKNKTNINISAAETLNLLRDAVITSLHQTGKIGEPQDGMDMSFGIINNNTNKLYYAGANNSIIITRHIEQKLAIEQSKKIAIEQKKSYYLIEIKPDRMPLSIFIAKPRPFTNHCIQLYENDTLYMYSDGYTDQFGGKNGKKFMMQRFKKLLFNIQNKPLNAQKQLIEKTNQSWKSHKTKSGTYFEQIDDILIMGIKI